MHVHLALVTTYQRGASNNDVLTRGEEIMRKFCKNS